MKGRRLFSRIRLLVLKNALGSTFDLHWVRELLTSDGCEPGFVGAEGFRADVKTPPPAFMFALESVRVRVSLRTFPSEVDSRLPSRTASPLHICGSEAIGRVCCEVECAPPSNPGRAPNSTLLSFDDGAAWVVVLRVALAPSIGFKYGLW